MAVCFILFFFSFGFAGTTKASTYTARHSFFQRYLERYITLIRNMCQCFQHRHWTASKHFFKYNVTNTVRYQTVMTIGTVICYYNYVTACFYKILFQNHEFFAAKTDYDRCIFSILFCQVQQRRHANTAAYQQYFFLCIPNFITMTQRCE